MKPRLLSLLLAVVIGLWAIVGCGPGQVPVGQPEMTVITGGSVETLQQEFNKMAATNRLVLLLSPT